MKSYTFRPTKVSKPKVYRASTKGIHARVKSLKLSNGGGGISRISVKPRRII